MSRLLAKLTWFMVLIGGGSAAVWAVNLEELVSAELAVLLEADGSVKVVQLREPKPVLLPNGALGAMAKEAIASLDPSLVVEALYLYRKPEIAAVGRWTEAERTALYNALTGIGSLKGIQYYSASRGRMRTLYDSSYLVDGPQGRTALDDPVVALPPERATLYAVQKDLTFGEHRYRYDFQVTQEGFLFVQENLTEINYGIVPLLGKGKLRTVVLVADAGASLVIYVASAARTTLVPGVEGKVRESFANRVDALYKWFTGRADAALLANGGG